MTRRGRGYNPPSCGTTQGYHYHRKHNEPIDDECEVAHALYLWKRKPRHCGLCHRPMVSNSRWVPEGFTVGIYGTCNECWGEGLTCPLCNLRPMFRGIGMCNVCSSKRIRHKDHTCIKCGRRMRSPDEMRINDGRVDVWRGGMCAECGGVKREPDDERTAYIRQELTDYAINRRSRGIPEKGLLVG